MCQTRQLDCDLCGTLIALLPAELTIPSFLLGLLGSHEHTGNPFILYVLYDSVILLLCHAIMYLLSYKIM